MSPIKRILVIGTAMAAALAGQAREADADNCKDHPLFNRMPGFYIQRCERHDFDAHAFGTVKGRERTVEGRYQEILYAIQPGAKEPSRLQVQKNFENAVLKLGGSVLGRDDDGNVYLRVAREGREVWIHVNAYISSQYTVYTVEKAAMEQVIQADAASFDSGLQAEGKVAVYGLHFDTGQAELKPDSGPALAEIAKLLKAHPALKLNVVGHTDNVAGLDANLRLSQARAEAVILALEGGLGLKGGRLKAYGVGPLAPVASNDTEEGRAKNRRVELVKP